MFSCNPVTWKIFIIPNISTSCTNYSEKEGKGLGWSDFESRHGFSSDPLFPNFHNLYITIILP